MKIIQAVGWYFPETAGGTEVYAAELARRLYRAGHHVVIAAPDPGGETERQYNHDGIPVYRFPTPATLTRDEAQTRVPVRGAERFHTWLAVQRPDVVHFHTLVPGLEISEVAAARTTGARIVATTHSSSLGHICARGTMMRWGRRLCDGVSRPWTCAACDLQRRGLPQMLAAAAAAIPSPLSEEAGRLPGRLGTVVGRRAAIVRAARLQSALLEQVDSYVLLTQWALDAVARNGAPRQKLVLNRLGTAHAAARQKPGPDERPTRQPVRIGYLGRFDRIKGVHVLARAIAAIPSNVPLQVEFRGPVRQPAESRARDEVAALVAGDPRVRIDAEVPFADVSSCLAAYDVLCCPSLCLEGGPTVAIEAHAVGTPVIGSRIGGLAELITDGINGRLTPPGDWRALADALTDIAMSPAATIDRWRGALPRARTMDEVADDYLRLYAA